MAKTPHLNLPYISAAQAQKHVTHNEALRALDAIVHLSVLDRDLSTPPTSPNEGDRYLVASNATGDWSGQDHSIAAFQDGAWGFYTPNTGWLAWIVDEAILVGWDGSNWIVSSGGSGSSGSDSVNLNPVTGGLVGVNATADTTNRLSVNSPATLFNHEGDDHQIKVNKNTNSDTASVLFQTGFSGRAEFGLTGDDNFHMKVSPDGNNWNEALTINQNDGFIGIGINEPEGPLHVINAGVSPIFEKIDNTAGSGMPIARKARGTVSAKSSLQNGDSPGGLFSQGYDGDNYVGCCNIRYAVDGIVSAGNIPTRLEIWNFQNGIGYSKKFEILNDGTTRPAIDNAYSLGDASHRWASVWSANGVIQTSDKREKIVVGDLSFAGKFVDSIDPILFKWKTGSNDLTPHPTRKITDDAGCEISDMEIGSEPGKRVHAGFAAQDVKSAMNKVGQDFAAWGLGDVHDENSKQWIRPDELIPVLWKALKETREEIRNLNNKIK